ncbi:MAG: EI24 domain-containing protein [Bdellovibrio sp.]|jgi:CysZ protein
MPSTTSAQQSFELERVMRSLLLGLRDFVHPRVILLSLMVFLTGILFWVIVLGFVGGPLLAWITQMTTWDFTGFWGILLLVLASFPIVLIVSLVLLSVLAFPWVRRFLSSRGYQDRPVMGQVSLVRQIIEIFFVSLLGLGSWLLFLVFFWVPILPGIFTLAVLGWVQWRLLTLDQWSGTQSWEDLKRLRGLHQSEGFFLSFLLALGSLVPVFNLFLPVLSALCFAHWDGELRREKNRPV